MNGHLSRKVPDTTYQSYVFLLGVDGVWALDHELYVCLARGADRLAQFAGRTLRLADWHVKLQSGNPSDIANEWYGWVRFDDAGRLLPHGGPALSSNRTEMAERFNVDTAALPSAPEVDAMRAHVFSATGPGLPVLCSSRR